MSALAAQMSPPDHEHFGGEGTGLGLLCHGEVEVVIVIQSGEGHLSAFQLSESLGVRENLVILR